MEKYDLSLLTCGDYVEYLNRTFSIRLSPHQVMVSHLIEVTEFKNYSTLKRTPFSLVFQTQGESRGFPQGTYVIEHPILGNMEIFLVPIGPDRDGMRYEAIFS